MIDGFTVANSDLSMNRSGIRVVNAQNVTIQNCTIQGTPRRHRLQVHEQGLLLNNTISGTSKGYGILVSNSATEQGIIGNTVTKNRFGGIQLMGDNSTGGNGILKRCVIENNVLWGNGGGGAALGLDGVQRLHGRQ